METNLEAPWGSSLAVDSLGREKGPEKSENGCVVHTPTTVHHQSCVTSLYLKNKQPNWQTIRRFWINCSLSAFAFVRTQHVCGGGLRDEWMLTYILEQHFFGGMKSLRVGWTRKSFTAFAEYSCGAFIRHPDANKFSALFSEANIMMNFHPPEGSVDMQSSFNGDGCAAVCFYGFSLPFFPQYIFEGN